MATPWTVVPCLLTLRSEINALAPNRDHGSDGTIGDAEHSPASDHTPDEVSDILRGKDADRINEVHALDIDTDLREPGLTLQMIVTHILARCRSGREKRLRYIIFNRFIYEASNGWKARDYELADPHIGHAHFSAVYVTSHEYDTSSWTLEEIPVALTTGDKAWIASTINNAVTSHVDDLLAVKIGDAARPYRTVGDVLRDTAKLRGFLVGDVEDTKNAAISAGAPIAGMAEAAGIVIASAEHA